MVNYSTLASFLGVTSTTVKNYIDLLAGTYMVEIIPPYISNLGKRLVKSPNFAIECKASYSPVLSKGNYIAIVNS